MDQPAASASAHKVNAIMVNGRSNPDPVLPEISDSASYVAPQSHDQFPSTDDTQYGLTRQSMRKRRSSRQPGTQTGTWTPRDVDLDLGDCTGNINSIALPPDETEGNGGLSPRSSRKRRTTKSPKLVEIEDASVPLVGAGDREPSAKIKSSLRHSMNMENSAMENGEGYTTGSTRQSTRSRMPRITYESEFNPIASSKVNFFLVMIR